MPITSDRLTYTWQSCQPWELPYHIRPLEYMTLSASFLHNPYGDFPITHSASSQRGAASIFIISSNPTSFSPTFPPQLHSYSSSFSFKANTPLHLRTSISISLPCTPTGRFAGCDGWSWPTSFRFLPVSGHTISLPHGSFPPTSWFQLFPPWQDRTKSLLYIVRRSNISHIIWVGSRWEKRTLSIAPCWVGSAFRPVSENVGLPKYQQFSCKYFRVEPLLLSDSSTWTIMHLWMVF